MKKDFFCGLFFLGLGLLVWLTIPISIPHVDQFSPMGARFFPTFFSIILTVLGFILALQSLVKKASWKKEKIEYALIIKEEIPVFVTFLIFTVSCILFDRFQFLVAMPIAVTTMLVYYKEKKWYYYCIMYAFIVLFYLIFTRFMFVIL